MKLHRFIGKFNLSDKQILSNEVGLAHQIKSVLRIRKGEQIILCDGNGNEAIFSVLLEPKGLIFVRESDIQSAWTPKKQIIVCLALIKKENFELAAQKMTELGVAKIIPIISARAIKTGLNMNRIRKIMQEASEQSGRGDIPELSEILSFEDSLNIKGDKAILITSDEQSSDTSTLKYNENTIFIGPAGGWTDEEVVAALRVGAKKINLGPMIMRAETAAIIATFLFANK